MESSPLVKEDGGRFWRTTLGLGLIIGGDFCASLALNFYNTWLMRQVPGFDFPIIYTCMHMIASFIVASLLIFGARVAPAKWEQARTLALQILVLAFSRGASITTNNWSLEYINIGLNKVIKASVPVFTVVISLLLERKRYSPYRIAALFVLAAGAMMSSLSTEATEGNFRGILLALCSAACGGFSVVMGSILMGSSTGLGPISLLFYIAPCQVVMLSTIVPFKELSPFVDFLKAPDQGALTALYLTVGTLLAVAFNLMAYVQLQVAHGHTQHAVVDRVS